MLWTETLSNIGGCAVLIGLYMGALEYLWTHKDDEDAVPVEAQLLVFILAPFFVGFIIANRAFREEGDDA